MLPSHTARVCSIHHSCCAVERVKPWRGAGVRSNGPRGRCVPWYQRTSDLHQFTPDRSTILLSAAELCSRLAGRSIVAKRPQIKTDRTFFYRQRNISLTTARRISCPTGTHWYGKSGLAPLEQAKILSHACFIRTNHYNSTYMVTVRNVK